MKRSVATIWFGLALVCLALLSILGVTYLGLIALGIPGVIALILGATAFARQGGGRPQTWFDANVFTLAFASLVTVWAILFIGLGRKMQVSFPVRCQEGPASARYPGEPEVTITFDDYPGYHLTYFSRELAACLERHRGRSFEGVFELTLDFGSLRGFRQVSLGGCSTLVGTHGGSFGSSGDAEPSPFAKWE